MKEHSNLNIIYRLGSNVCCIYYVEYVYLTNCTNEYSKNQY